MFSRKCEDKEEDSGFGVVGSNSVSVDDGVVALSKKPRMSDVEHVATIKEEEPEIEAVVATNNMHRNFILSLLRKEGKQVGVEVYCIDGAWVGYQVIDGECEGAGPFVDLSDAAVDDNDCSISDFGVLVSGPPQAPKLV